MTRDEAIQIHALIRDILPTAIIQIKENVGFPSHHFYLEVDK